jgi:Transglycosylase SLT domain
MKKGELRVYGVTLGLIAFVSNYQVGWDEQAISALGIEKADTASSANNTYDIENLNKIYKEVSASRPWLDWRYFKSIIQQESGEGTLLNSEFTGDCTPRNGKMPPDWTKEKPLCWGRGLGQQDYGSHKEWLNTNDWRDPRIALNKAAQTLDAAYQSALEDDRISEDMKLYAATAAYNAGWGGVDKALDEGKDPGAKTTKKTQADGRSLNYPQSIQVLYEQNKKQYPEQ